MTNGEAVPEMIARLGITLHYYADRSSHWYGVDSPGSGVMLEQRTASDYDLYLYLEAKAFSFVTHANAHFWEQGMGVDDTYVAPGTLAAMYQMYDVLAEFAEEFQAIQQEWFTLGARSMSKAEAIGSQDAPGFLYDIVRHRKAADRAQAHQDALHKAGLPPLPGWESSCSHDEQEDGVVTHRFADGLARLDKSLLAECHLAAVLGLGGANDAEIHWPQFAADVAAHMDVDKSGFISSAELAAWLGSATVERHLASCSRQPLSIIA